MYIVYAERGKNICLGREGENLARQIVFDVSQWGELYGPGVVQLIARRTGDSEPYPCKIEVTGTQVIWTITNADTAKPGCRGECELSYHINDRLAKSEIYQTVVVDAMCEPSDTAPEPYQGWLDKILAAGSYAEAERIQAEAARDEADKRAKDALESANAAARSEQESKDLAENISKAVAAGVETIQSEGNTQVERVAQEGAAQVEAVGALAKQAEENAAAAALSEQNTKASEEAAAKSAKQAEETVNNAAWIAAEVDENGHLIVTQSDNFNGATFAINENGNLEVSYT